MWREKEVAIAEVQTLLDNGYEVEVDSADGFVEVTDFVYKGYHDEFVLEMEDPDYESTYCSGEHLFETTLGWRTARELSRSSESVNILTRNGYSKGIVKATGNTCPIVDITVDHDNHRYYTNGVSSHNTGVGKSMFMCHQAASILTQGKNVLYITLEMAEERIAERIDANLMNVPIDQIENMSYEQYAGKIESLAKKNTGKLIIKEYPTGAAHSGHFRALLEELQLKRDFLPDMIFVDYLNICSSSRMKGLGGSINTYSLIKSIAEEIRGLAIEFDLPIVTATQSNREGFANSEVDLNNTSESFGVPATADMMFALISTEDLQNLGQVMIKQLKNRYSDPTQNKRFVLGVDKTKMRFFDAEDNAQTLVQDTGPVFDSSDTASRIGTERKDFTGVKV